jgi:hypothetical protein
MYMAGVGARQAAGGKLDRYRYCKCNQGAWLQFAYGSRQADARPEPVAIHLPVFFALGATVARFARKHLNA